MGQSDLKILCTGNPAHATVASAVQTKWPYCDFASRATGYDLRFWDPGSEDFFKSKIINYNVFINSSFICKWAQHTLLETTHQIWSSQGINGHIITIGSIAEWEGINSNWGDYVNQKVALRNLSLQLNSKNNIKTTYVIAGGLQDSDPAHAQWLPMSAIAEVIEYAVYHAHSVPLIQIQK